MVPGQQGRGWALPGAGGHSHNRRPRAAGLTSVRTPAPAEAKLPLSRAGRGPCGGRRPGRDASGGVTPHQRTICVPEFTNSPSLGPFCLRGHLGSLPSPQKLLRGTPGGGRPERGWNPSTASCPEHVPSVTSLHLSFSRSKLMGLNNKISKAFSKSRPLSALGIYDE